MYKVRIGDFRKMCKFQSEISEKCVNTINSGLRKADTLHPPFQLYVSDAQKTIKHTKHIKSQQFRL